MKVRIIILLMIVSGTVGYGQDCALFREFKDPGREYSIAPFWSWNGTLRSEELKRQMDLMMEQGIYGAFMHARAGLDDGETPYFSPEWWAAVDTVVHYAGRTGFQAWLYDENKWPSGSAGGRTISRNPDEFVKKGLKYTVTRLQEGNTFPIDGKERIRIFAVRMTGENRFDVRSQVDLTQSAPGQWTAPAGSWAVLDFEQVVDGRPVKHIDYLDSTAVRTFMDITHEEYYRRYAPFFGNTIPGIFFDEIRFNIIAPSTLPWSDDFADSFKKQKGYDILDELPSLIFRGSRSESINYDFLDELTRRYDRAWFTQIADWCGQHGIDLTGHTNEGFSAYREEGDYLKTIGRLQIPGTDNEEFRYSFPRYVHWYKPKQLSSAAHIYGRNRTMVEAMGGGGYLITPEEYRYGIARLGVCGINFFIPHLFHYTDDNPAAYNDWPPSWFFRNPYWKYFKPLADYGRRISCMNRQGSHVCHVALLYPLTDQWADGYTASPGGKDYMDVQDILLNNQIDYDIMNDDAFLRSDCSAGEIRLHDESYKVLILPSMDRIKYDVAEKIAEFYRRGGIVIAAGKIPHLSVYRQDNAVNALMHDIFGIRPELAGSYHEVGRDTFEPYTSNAGPTSGNAHYVKEIYRLPYVVRKHIPDEIKVMEGEPMALRCLQRKKDDIVYYLLMNEERKTNHFQVRLPDYGVPYRLNIETGEVTAIDRYLVSDGKLLIPLDFQPWEAFYLAFVPEKKESPEAIIASTSLEDAKVHVSDGKVTVSGWAGPETRPYATVQYRNGAREDYRFPLQESFPPVTLDGDWHFQVAGKNLDRQWTYRISKDTVALPVMKFYADYEWKRWNFSDPDFDDRHLPEIKIVDRFSERKGIVRYLNLWNASRIIPYNKDDRGAAMNRITGQNAVFVKVFHLNGTPTEAKLKITAEPSYTLYINGARVGAGEGLENVGEYDMVSFLKAGDNEIRVEVPEQKGLVAEGEIKTEDGLLLLHTDDSWEAETDGIREPALILGKPSLGSWRDIRFKMRGKGIQFPLTCWYRQVLPAGATELILPERSGTFEYYVNGLLQKERNGKVKIPAVKSNRPVMLAVKVVTSSAQDGLRAPIRVVCEGIDVRLIPWKELGLEWYTGRGIYTKEFVLPAGFDSKGVRTILDLGEVKWFAEIWINGQLVKFFPWGDFKAEATQYLKKGKNRVDIVVSNLRANETFRDIPDELIEQPYNRWWHQGVVLREKDRLVSGLLGPVRLIPMQYVEQ
jgi:hypothetical protein